jgi:cysteine desulfuration protein SufE
MTETQIEIIEDFAMLDQWQDKYEYIIQLGKELDAIPQDLLKEEDKIKGCQSNVWIVSDFNKEENKVYFKGESDALIVKGLVALVLKVYSGLSPKQIIETEPEFIKSIGLETHLSATRSNGLASMIKQIKHFAIAYNHLNN